MAEKNRRNPSQGNPAALSEWLALKDRALDVAAEGFTIADARDCRTGR